MNKIIPIIAASMGLAASALAQGSIAVDNSTVGGGVSIGSTLAAGNQNYFYGNLTLQVWYLNGSLPANVTSDSNTQTTGLIAYNNLTADGFTLAQTYSDITMTAGDPGVFTLNGLDMPGASSTSTIIALVAWTQGAQGNTATPASTFAGAVNGGLLAFSNPTANYTISPTPTPAALSGWTGVNDIVMVPVPEPTTMALAGLGGLSLFLARRKK